MAITMEQYPARGHTIMLLPKFRNSCTDLIDRPSDDDTNDTHYFFT